MSEKALNDANKQSPIERIRKIMTDFVMIGGPGNLMGLGAVAVVTGLCLGATGTTVLSIGLLATGLAGFVCGFSLLAGYKYFEHKPAPAAGQQPKTAMV